MTLSPNGIKLQKKNIIKTADVQTTVCSGGKINAADIFSFA